MMLSASSLIGRWRCELVETGLVTETNTAVDQEPKLSSAITRLVLRDFKGFHQAELDMSGFTVVVGTNASGKRNLRDAFRFIHGIGRGYTLAEIIGEKWIEGGVRCGAASVAEPARQRSRGQEAFLSK